MAYTSAFAVVIGAATKKTDVDSISTNTDYLQTLDNVDHNIHVSTGTGYHKASHGSPTHFYNGTNYVVEWWDFTNTAKPIKRFKVGIGSVPTPSGVTDGDFFMPASGAAGEGQPTTIG